MASLAVNETIHVTDSVPTPLPVVPLGINETVHVSDAIPTLVSAAPIFPMRRNKPASFGLG
jgi:hypothetical protein